VAAETGVPYHNTPTLRAAIASHYRMLKQLGRRNPAQPGQPWSGLASS
jgi:hypothetical protein